MAMSAELRARILEQLDAISLIDPHSHIDALDPASHTLADILGYHYYTELAHSAGMPKSNIEAQGVGPKERVGRLVEYLGHLDNTIQAEWLSEMVRIFFGFEDGITSEN